MFTHKKGECLQCNLIQSAVRDCAHFYLHFTDTFDASLEYLI